MIQDKLNKVLNEYPLFNKENKLNIQRKDIINFANDLRSLMIPGFYHSDKTYEEIYTTTTSLFTYVFKYSQISTDITAIVDTFFSKLPHIIQLLTTDVEAFYQGDPAAKSKEEIILAYPGFYAICMHRLAHELYLLNIPYLPRILSELAHSSTGIDINPGATIGSHFFIDHGTGIVIGETTTIGNHVKIYQGVTLGALSVANGQALKGIKRHPTIEDNVTIYANAIILGGNVVIGENSTIGGNTFITESIPANSLVKSIPNEIKIKSFK